MSDARRSDAWDHTALRAYQFFEANKGKKAPKLAYEDFHPFLRAVKPKAERIPATVQDLKGLAKGRVKKHGGK